MLTQTQNTAMGPSPRRRHAAGRTHAGRKHGPRRNQKNHRIPVHRRRQHTGTRKTQTPHTPQRNTQCHHTEPKRIGKMETVEAITIIHQKKATNTAKDPPPNHTNELVPRKTRDTRCSTHPILPKRHRFHKTRKPRKIPRRPIHGITRSIPAPVPRRCTADQLVRNAPANPSKTHKQTKTLCRRHRRRHKRRQPQSHRKHVGRKRKKHRDRPHAPVRSCEHAQRATTETPTPALPHRIPLRSKRPQQRAHNRHTKPPQHSNNSGTEKICALVRGRPRSAHKRNPNKITEATPPPPSKLACRTNKIKISFILVEAAEKL